MANHAREKRGTRNQRSDKLVAVPSLTVVPNLTHTDDQPPTPAQPTIANPASWTLDFCLKMASLSREDQNPLPAHIWTTRGHTIEFELARKRKHPFIGMPVNEHGEAIPAPPPVISGDWKTELLGQFTSEVENVKHSDQ